jgi:hypothetical protein
MKNNITYIRKCFTTLQNSYMSDFDVCYKITSFVTNNKETLMITNTETNESLHFNSLFDLMNFKIINKLVIG